MKHSKNYDKVTSYYNMYKDSDGEFGWSIKKVRDAVNKNWITDEEFEEITGEKYLLSDLIMMKL